MGEGDYSVLVTYQSLLINVFPLAPPKLFFSIKYDEIDYSVWVLLNDRILWFTTK